ncbi:uncharacterized protein LOC143236360 [Tachypleus tridentatus]|uniref:uncharacterized protein LOC143236360 n=1 Tax=Tachypleus tridentatus TaxID=6853 RepID=UPI003FD50737
MIMTYTSLGVPLTLVWLMLIGSSLANFWTLIIFQVCCGPHERRKNKRVHSEMSETAHDQHLLDTCAQQNHLNTGSSVIQSSIKISPTGGSFRSKNGKEASSKKLENCNKVLRSDVSVPFNISQGETSDNDHNVVIQWNGNSHVSKDVMSRDLIIPIVFAIVFFIIYLIFGATVLSVIHRWPLMDSIYLSFLMFATLGICVLQDVPSAVIMLNTSDWQNVYFIIFIIGGFLLMAMIFNLVLKQSKVTKRKRLAARKMKT